MNLAIIGGGASVKNYLPRLWKKLEDLRIYTMSINYAYKFMPYAPNFQVWLDTDFFQENKAELLQLYDKHETKLITQDHPDYFSHPQITTYKTNTKYIAEDVHGLTTNGLFKGLQGLSGTFGLSYASYFGFYKIFLFGFDFGDVNGETHFYSEVKHRGYNNFDYYKQENGLPREEVADYIKIAEATKSRIYNCSLESKINAFEKIDFTKYTEKHMLMARGDENGC